MTIALVMIVKDEETVLRSTLETYRLLADEWVICDTGSTDATKAIILDVTGTPHHNLEFTNYVDTKNRALALATADYVIFADADEPLISGAAKLRNASLDPDTDGLGGWIVEGPDPGGPYTNRYARLRMWRNDGRWRFSGPNVHEVCTGGAWRHDPEIVVYHDHRHRSAGSYDKFTHWAQLLEEFLRDHPNDSRALFYAGRTYQDLGDFPRAIEYYTRYLANPPAFKDEVWQAKYDRAQCFKALGEYPAALAGLQEAVNHDPRRAEALTLAGQLYYDLQDWPRAISHLEQALRLNPPDDVILFLDPRAYRERPADLLQIAYDRQRNYPAAARAAQIAVTASTVPEPRLRENAWWARRRLNRKWFLVLGHTPEPCSPGSLETGCGGVETTYIELAEELARADQDVTVFARCADQLSPAGARWLPTEELDRYLSLSPDVIITSRHFAAFDSPEAARAHRILWLQDAFFADPGQALSQTNRIVISSAWHRHYVAERYGHAVPAEKIAIIPLAIRPDLYTQNVQRDPHEVIYASNPDRGLYELAAMWPELRRRHPALHLTVAYGWEGLRTWDPSESWQRKVTADRARCLAAFEQAGNVTFTGRLGKSALARAQLRAALCLYPNNFWETYCLAALECQAAGTPLITTAQGALTTTCHPSANVLLPGRSAAPAYQAAFIQAASDLLGHPAQIAERSRTVRAFARQQPTWPEIAQLWRELDWSI